MQNRIFSQKMVEACEAALDSGVFYQEDFKSFVLERMGGFGCEGVCIASESFDAESDNYLSGFSALLERLSTTVKSSPRGHYAVVHRYKRGDTTFSHYTVLASDGTGNLATGCEYHSHKEMPGKDLVLSEMIGYEIFQCRKQVEGQRRIASDIAALEKYQFQVGQEFKNYRQPGDFKVYSKALVTRTYPETGQVQLYLIRRGTSKRWETTVGAASLANRLGLVACHDMPVLEQPAKLTQQQACLAY